GDGAGRRHRHADRAAGRRRDHHLSRVRSRQLQRAAPVRARRDFCRVRPVPPRWPDGMDATGLATSCLGTCGGRAMIKVTALSKSFGALRAVSNLSFEAIPAGITSIIGPNGAGKSTAFNLIAGTLRPDAGKVEFAGADVTGLPPYVLAARGMAR